MREDTRPAHSNQPVRGDGLVELVVEADAMAVSARFTPPAPGGQPVTRGYVEQLLKGEGITHGIDWDAIDAAVEACGGDPYPAEPADVVLARGTPPVAHQASRYRFHPAFAAIRALIEEASGDPAVALHRHHTLPVVYAGQPICVLETERSGAPGTTVRGETVPVPEETVESLRPGSNTRRAGDRIVAARSGLLCVTGGEVRVEPDLALACDVNSTTGDISFPGNLALTGTVADGFRLWVGGDLVVHEALDAHEVFCRGQLTAAGGIIGKQRALVRCRGKVRTKFVERCAVESKSSVYVEKFSYDARITSLDRLVTGEHGKIVGGEITAAHGVTAGEIGNRAEVATRIAVGTDFIVARRLEKTRRALERVQAALDRIDRRLAAAPTRELRERRMRLAEKRDASATILENLTKKLDRNEQASVTARQAVHPGTIIEICRARLDVTEPLGPTTFRLDMPSGRIVLEEPGAEPAADLHEAD